MSLVKTEKGKLALQNRDPALSPRDRQILILCNGTRSDAALASLMGTSVLDDIPRLLDTGYLAPMPIAAAPLAVVAPAPAKPREQKVPQQQPATARRSLAGTKMYIMDMLQLMRDMDASAMAVSIHTSEGEYEFIANVIAAARLVAQKRGLSYGMRVLGKLKEIAPESHVPSLEALGLELESAEQVP
jgi:hypothetical protein